MATAATITIDAADIAARGWNIYFRPIFDRARDVEPAWDGVRAAFFEIEYTLFAHEGQTSERAAWVPLSENYEAWKRHVAPGKPILRLHDNLYKELTGQGPYTERRGRRTWIYATEATVMEESESGDMEEMYLATIHMRGLYHRKPPMPARPPVRLTTGDRERIGKIVVDYVVYGETNAG